MPKNFAIPSVADLKREFGDVDDFYNDDDEIKEKRADWNGARRGVVDALRDAYRAANKNLLDAVPHLLIAREIENDWGDWPMTQRHAKILGVYDVVTR